jgi:hypothetical protein
MFRTYVHRDGTINLGPYREQFRSGTVVDVSMTRAGSLLVVVCDEPAVIEIAARGRRQWVLEELMERISNEESDDVRLFGAHYLRYLRKLSPRSPTRAAYGITQPDAKRVRAYIEVAWEQIKYDQGVLPRAD